MSPRLVLVPLLAAGLAACGSAPDTAAAGDAGPRVVATTTILGDVVRELVGDAGTVTVLMEGGQDPHGFAPSAQQAAALRDADLVVANGLGLEEGLDDALSAAEEDGVEVLHVAETVDPREFETGRAEGEDHAEDDHADEDHAAGSGDHAGHDHGPLDPHVWMDPVRMGEAVQTIAARLAELAPDGDVDWTARGEAVAATILDAHAEVTARLDVIPEACRQLVTNHDALGYLAERYDLEVVGTVIPGSSTQAAASAEDFAALVDLLQETEVPAVFADTTVNQDLARSLAGEVGRDIQVVDLYTGSLGEPGSGADTYVGLLTTDARRIADALADC